MAKLLKADFYRIMKSKLFMAAAILAAVFPIITVLLYLGLDFFLKNSSELTAQLGLATGAGINMTGKALISESFVLSSNMGLILPVFITIFVAMDITSGTLRNKIIAGRSRRSIYISHLITSGLISSVLMLVSTGIFTVMTCLVFGYGVPFDKTEALNLVYFFVTGFFTYFFTASVSTAVTLSIKNAAPAVIVSSILNMGFGFLGSFLHSADPKLENKWLCLVPSYTNTQFLANASSVPFDFTSFILGIASYLVFIILISAAGMIIFTRKDIK